MKHLHLAIIVVVEVEGSNLPILLLLSFLLHLLHSFFEHLLLFFFLFLALEGDLVHGLGLVAASTWAVSCARSLAGGVQAALLVLDASVYKLSGPLGILGAEVTLCLRAVG